MSTKEMISIKDDRELDALVAERVFGWSHCEPIGAGKRYFGLPPDSKPPEIVSRYSTDIASAMLVVEKMRERGLQLFELQQLRGDWAAIFSTDGLKGRMKACVSAETASRAICLAALEATKEKG